MTCEPRRELGGVEEGEEVVECGEAVSGENVIMASLSLMVRELCMCVVIVELCMCVVIVESS